MIAGRRSGFVAAAAAAALAIGLLGYPAAAGGPAAASSSGTAAATSSAGRGAATAGMAMDEEKFLALVNAERRARGVGPLVYDPVAVEVARAHSREMSARNYFGHESPDPENRTPLQRYLRAERAAGGKQPQYLLVGENLFYSSATGVERGHEALMASTGHRRNILDGRFDAIGVGTYTSPRGEYWVTQVFLKKRD